MRPRSGTAGHCLVRLAHRATGDSEALVSQRTHLDRSSSVLALLHQLSARSLFRRFWLVATTDPLPTPQEALGEPFAAFPSI
jgi:hypothetical protein